MTATREPLENVSLRKITDMERQGKTRLLIVDDEEDMLRLLKRSLSADLDCEVQTCTQRVPGHGASGGESL